MERSETTEECFWTELIPFHNPTGEEKRVTRTQFTSRTVLFRRVDGLFSDLDAILTAPAPGEAPPGLASTGKATFNLLWTYLWMPCITLPFARGPSGLPVGIQLVGRQHEDSALLSIAAWVRSALS